MVMKRLVLRWGWDAGWSELNRSRRIPHKEKLALNRVAGAFEVVLLGSAFGWWMLTGKRVPGPLGRWLAPPPLVYMNEYPKRRTQMRSDMVAALLREAKYALESTRTVT